MTPKLHGKRGAPEEEIIRRIKERGRVTLAEFMEIALYWVDGGYYTSKTGDGAGPWGGGGDYITNTDISPFFAKLLSKQIHEIWQACGEPSSFDVIEAGAGRGLLSKGMLDAFKESWPEFYNAVTIRLIEKNQFLRLETSEKVSWYASIDEVKTSGAVCVLSNELIDSFPAHRVVWRNGVLKEVFTAFDGNDFINVEDSPSTDGLSRYLDNAGIGPFEGMVMEINLNAVKWISDVARRFEKGFVVTVDYGLPARELYSPERMDGSLMCHYRHTLNSNPYLNIGAQDITTHVDFTSLANAGKKAGLELTGFTTQKNFLLGLGVLNELQEVTSFGFDAYDKIKSNQRLAELITPGGAGDTFKVMIQHKGLDNPALKGFSFKEMSRYL
ncbi:SAM-dependent methyltransferase [bacterium]|nr:MAG: SAM-dependent methyltransferase [bacterium]